MFVIQSEEFGLVTSRVTGGSRDHEVGLSQEGPSLASVTSFLTPLLSGLVPIMNTGRGGGGAGKALQHRSDKSESWLCPSCLGNQLRGAWWSLSQWRHFHKGENGGQKGDMVP